MKTIHPLWVTARLSAPITVTAWSAEVANEIKATTPPENTPREVQVFSKIDARGIREDFFTVVARYSNLDLGQARKETQDRGPRDNERSDIT